jgi:hypothetical protein
MLLQITQSPKKLGSRLVTETHESTIRKRLFVTDRDHCKSFLIDSGSEISIIPRSFHKRAASKNNLKLYAANETEIKTFGITNPKLRICKKTKL